MKLKGLREKMIAHLKATIAVCVLVFLLFPLILAYIVFAGSLFTIPGSPELWFGFWASYLGMGATIAVAVISYKGNQKLNLLQEEASKQEIKLTTLMTDFHFILKQVRISPFALTHISCGRENDILYRMVVEIEKTSYAVIRRIDLGSIRFTKYDGEKENILKSEQDFKEKHEIWQQDNTYILQIDILGEKNSSVSELFTQFYFYFSQFQKNRDRLHCKIELLVETYDLDRQDDSEKDTEIKKSLSWLLEADLRVLPVIDEVYRENKIDITGYQFLRSRVAGRSCEPAEMQNAILIEAK